MPNEGDLVWADLDPVLGREQGGRRPALVLTDRVFHENRETAIICPVTRNVAEWPTKVMLPDGLKASGAIVVEQIRLVHRATRGFDFIDRVPNETLKQVQRILVDLLKIDI